MGDIERDMYRERYINGDREITREKEGGVVGEIER